MKESELGSGKKKKCHSKKEVCAATNEKGVTTNRLKCVCQTIVMRTDESEEGTGATPKYATRRKEECSGK